MQYGHKASQFRKPMKNKNFQTNVKTKNKYTQTETKLKHIEQCSNRMKKMNSKIKSLKKQVKRKQTKIQSVTDLLNELKRKTNMNQNLESILKNHFSGFPLEFVLSLDTNTKSKKTRRRYTPVLTQFCLTLFYYSPKAYRFVRKIFPLPHPSRIRSWVSNVNCEPGFIGEVFRFLEETKTELSGTKIKECSLIVDAMSIREQLIWDSKNKSYAGYVNTAGISNVDSEALAKEAVFFEIVSLSSSFKTPVAYFLSNGMTAEVLSNLIKTCISKLHEVRKGFFSIKSNFVLIG